MNGDTLWVWCYPSVSSDLRQVLLRKCCLTQDGRDFHTFVFGQFCRTWYYITTAEVQEPTALNKVQRCTADLRQRAVSTQHEQLFIHVCNMQMFFFFPFPSRLLIFQWLLLQKTSTPRSMQPSTECSAGTVSATHCLHGGVSTVLPIKHFECVSMCRMYIKHGSPVKMMEAYVTVLTKGICQSDENGSFLIKDYDVRKAYLAASVKGQSSSHMFGCRF